MRLNQPKVFTFIVSVVLVLIGVIAKLGVIAALANFAFWFVLVGFILLALAVLLKNL
ncbi:MAG TPA: hypothetical protein PLO92_02985 [Anaerolineaceae bacterium]|nr:hypothetical protein [Anaerolineales bacterium]HOG59154.1 hypothetical protein [Anaerolineaceae bacterium]HOR83579.1 hypothetical protein [Anaerolineaceae bacterium]HPL43689.1 hypothetical protein [Anaerolineaceae bacterium]HPY32841.1 hypothetical protein [Anaerolineaceae bacterium]